jgi:hypothetical protein
MRSLIGFLGRRVCVGSFVLLPLQRESRPGLAAGFCRGRQSPTVAPLAVEIARKDEFDAQAIGNILFGLQHMSSDVPEVRQVLAQMAAKMARCTEPLDAQAIGNGLYGLQNMSSDVPEVREALAQMAKMMARQSCYKR